MPLQSLRVHEGMRYLIHENGAPFFYLADTAWGLFHRLNREDALRYLENRAAKGFNAIQAVALHEFGGIEQPNAHGRYPFLRDEDGKWDPAKPDLGGEYGYWDHVDYIVGEAASRGLYIALLPTWGDKFNREWGMGPEVFDPQNAYAYGRFLGERYRDSANIIWVLGGDRPLRTRRHFAVVDAMARGLRDGDGGAHLMTFHPMGGHSSSEHVHGEDWLDFNMIQSGHSRARYNYEMIRKEYALVPPKPVVDGEPGYEQHPEAFNPQNGYLDEVDVRQCAYWAVLSGACGHTYGNHSVWGMWRRGDRDFGFQRAHFCADWIQAMDAPGAFQMAHLKNLMLRFDFLGAVPAPELIVEQLGGALFIPVLKGDGFLLAYTAQGLAIELIPGALNGALRAGWHDPRTGEISAIGEFDGHEPLRFTPPSGGRGQDWVLVLEAR